MTTKISGFNVTSMTDRKRNILLYVIVLVMIIMSCAEENPLAERDGMLRIDSISPSAGVAGTQVKIYGNGFALSPAENIVDLNGRQLIVKSPTALTSLVATIPAEATTGPINIRNGNQRVAGPVFTVIDPPHLEMIDPARGYAGDTVMLIGLKLRKISKVMFNNIEAKIVSIEDTKVVVIAPSSSTGTVSVEYEHGVVMGPIFTYIALPRIDTAALVLLSRASEGILIACENINLQTDNLRMYVDGQEQPIIQKGILQGMTFVVLDAPPRTTPNPLMLILEANGRKSESYEFVIKPDLLDLSVLNDGYPVNVSLYGRFFGNPDDQRLVIVTVDNQPVDVSILKWEPLKIDVVIPRPPTDAPNITYKITVVVKGQSSQTIEFWH